MNATRLDRCRSPRLIAALVILGSALAVHVASADQPTPRIGGVAVYDPVHQRVLMFGGATTPGAPDAGTMWSLPLPPGGSTPTWAPLSGVGGGGPAPSAGFHYTAVYDSRRHRVVFFGGAQGGYFPGPGWTLNSPSYLWVLQLSPSNPNGSQWLNFNVPGGPTPPARILTSAVYDSLADRIIFFGGLGGTIASPSILPDCWQLTVQTTPSGIDNYVWTSLSPGGANPPAARYGHGAFIDRATNQMMIVGGQPDDQNATTMIKVWGLSLSGTATWTQYNSYSSTPLKRGLFGSGFDRGFNRFVLYDGITTTGASNLYPACVSTPVIDNNYEWALYASTSSPGTYSWGWELASPHRLGLAGDYAEASAWASSRDVIANFGGGYYKDCISAFCEDDLVYPMNGTHLLEVKDLGIPMAWQTIQQTTVAPGACSEPGGGGGIGEFEGAITRPSIMATKDGGVVHIEFGLPKEGECVVEVFDLQGRSVVELAGGYRPAGRHQVDWNLLDRNGSRVRQAVYFARLWTPAGASVARVAISF